MNEERNIELKIGAEKIPAQLFKEKMNAFFDLLEEIGRDTDEGKKVVNWDISVEKGSQIIKAYPKPFNKKNYVDSVLNSFENGFDALTSGKQTSLSEKALDDIMKISKPYKNNGSGIDKIILSINNKSQILTENVRNNIKDIIGVVSEAYGSVEGKLEVISKRHGLSFIVTDLLTDKAVKCVFQDEKLLPRVFESFDKRVSIYGLIKYNKHGDIVSILVNDFRLLQKDHLPTSRDVLGIFN